MEAVAEERETRVRIKKPKWLRVKLPTGKEYKQVRDIVDKHELHTICESGNCPNMGDRKSTRLNSSHYS